MNNAINEIKGTLEGTNSGITGVENRISEVEDRMVEINEAERKKEKRIKNANRFSSVTRSCPTLSTPWTAAPQASLSITNSHLQFFPASGSFQKSQFIASGGQSTGTSASASVLPMNIQDWFPLAWTGWISLQTLKSLLQHTTQKHQFYGAQLSL